MPNESNHLYYARRSYFGPIAVFAKKLFLVVEPPGTAPGSVSPIPQRVYRHSQQAGIYKYSISLLENPVSILKPIAYPRGDKDFKPEGSKFRRKRL